jgi:hypothetical protein
MPKIAYLRRAKIAYLRRAKNAYLILRELHQQEKNREVALAAENIIDILIKTEDEISVENYKERGAS